MSGFRGGIFLFLGGSDRQWVNVPTYIDFPCEEPENNKSHPKSNSPLSLNTSRHLFTPTQCPFSLDKGRRTRLGDSEKFTSGAIVLVMVMGR